MWSYGNRTDVPIVTVCDWSPDELDIVVRAGLKYTVRSSKYPRTLKNPTRVTLILNNTHHFSVHAVLLQRFSTKLATTLSSTPTLKRLHINGVEDSEMGAWEIWLEWLYTLDKVPLPDFTPIRREHWRTGDVMGACVLSGWLGSAACEKYLLRLLMKELFEGRLGEGDLWALRGRMGRGSGLWHCKRSPFFLQCEGRALDGDTYIARLGSLSTLITTAYFRWKNAGKPAELDPFRWRAEHWYGICGKVGNWGCFHVMNNSGWGGVWERQRRLAGKMGWIGVVVGEEEKWDNGDEVVDVDEDEGWGSEGGWDND